MAWHLLDALTYAICVGSTEVDQVLDAMEYAVYVYDVENIILDNLQFMTSTLSKSGSSYERFSIQDNAIQKFR